LSTLRGNYLHVYILDYMKERKKGIVESLVLSVVTFIISCILVQYLVYEEYRIAKKNEHEQLLQELSRVKDGFRSILYSDLTVANALAFIHKSYGASYNFDSVCVQLMEANKYVEAMQITKAGVIEHVYPHERYDSTVGINTLADSMRKKEAESAVKRNDIFFAGPRKLRLGGIGILGKVPMFSDGKLIGFSVVLTKLPKIVAALDINDSSRQIYSYRLIKNGAADSAGYYFTKMLPADTSMAVSTQIPEGNWTLTVAYSTFAGKYVFPFVQSILGNLLALFAGIFVYRRTRQPFYLKEIIDLKTKELSKREKYYRKLIEANYDATVLLDDRGKVLYQTPSAEKITGYSLAEVRGMEGIDLIHPDDKASDNQSFVNLLSKPGEILHMTHRFKHRKGHYIWLESTYRNLLHDENVRGIVLNYHEITDKVVAQHQLKERAKELTTIFYTNEILKDDQQSAHDVFSKIVEVLREGWQYPEVCAARINFDKEEFRTGNYVPSDFSQVEQFNLIDGRLVMIEVVYLKEMPVEYEGPFLKEERDLIKTVAETIKIYFNKAIQQRSLVSSEANFRGSFEHAAIGMALVSPDGKFLKVNRALYDMLGYTEEELLSLTFPSITHPDNVPENIENLLQLLDGTKDFYRTEKRYLHKDGSAIWASISSAIVRNSKGAPPYFVTQVENVTEKHESQLKFQDLVEKSLVGVYIIKNGRFVYVNPRIVEESGYSEQELLTEPIGNFIHSDDISVVQKNIEARLTGKSDEARYEIRAYKKSRELMWMEMFGAATIYQGTPAIIGTMVNITGKKQVYSELKRSEANLRSIFNNTQASFLLLDDQMNILVFNDYFADGYARQTGYTLKPGINFLELVIPEKRQMISRNFETVRESGKPLEYESVYTNTGTEQYFSATISPVMDSGVFIGFCHVGFNITGRKKLEMEREDMIDDLLKKNRDLHQFSYIVSHNIRGPLSTILGVSNLLQENMPKEGLGVLLEAIKTTSERMDLVIRDLNEILQIKKEMPEAKVNVDLNKLLVDVTERLAHLINEKNAVIEPNFAAANELLTVKPYMSDIFYHLVSNSLKYSKPGTPPVIKIWSEIKNRKVVINFEDEGTGIDLVKNKNKMFMLYQRFHHTIEGRGLGLFMTKTQVEALNGNIEVESEPGAGTKFRVSFPVQK
jgi:PAS domain S-box-containing protein